MKLLLDACVSGTAALALRDAGHDVVWAGEWSDDPGDAAILARAAAEGRVLVTIDKDFGELIVLHGAAHAGVVRLVGFSGTQQGSICLRALAKYAARLEEGAIVTVEPGRVRVRLPRTNGERP